MNARQAAKAASLKIKSMEHTLALNKADIIDYNLVIQALIAGKSPCDWCEDLQECQLEAKGKNGCSEWMLRFQRPAPEEVVSDGQEAGTEKYAIFGVEESR